jgi:hypothetical protein
LPQLFQRRYPRFRPLAHHRQPPPPDHPAVCSIFTDSAKPEIFLLKLNIWPSIAATALGISETKNLTRFETVQADYSIARRDVERELVPLLEAEKPGLLVWSWLAGGLLSGKVSRENQKPEGSRRSTFDFPVVDKERAWKVPDVMAPHR